MLTCGKPIKCTNSHNRTGQPGTCDATHGRCWLDAAVADTPHVVIGSGVRHSKLLLPGKLVASLPGARVIDGLAR